MRGHWWWGRDYRGIEALQKDIFTSKGLIDQGSFDCLPSLSICTQGLAIALFDVKTT